MSVKKVCDLFEDFEKSDLYPKAFFSNETGAIAALGAKRHFDHLPKGLDEEVFGGFGFFEGAHFFSPQKILRSDPLSLSPSSYDLPKRIGESELFPFSQYKKGIERVVNSPIKKVVIARTKIVEYDRPLNPYDIMRHLPTKGSTLFGFMWNDREAFIGATPEVLYTRSGEEIATMALAGTRPLGETQKQDLLNSKKDMDEFLCVKEWLHETLSQVATGITASPIGVKETPFVQHLISHFKGKLSATDEALIRTLHPTPALGGLPRKEALEMIRDIEPFERGWYGAPVGFAGPDDAQFFVAIRSAMIDGPTLQPFAGGGIVDGSIPETEWEETNHKLKLWDFL